MHIDIFVNSAYVLSDAFGADNSLVILLFKIFFEYNNLS